MSGGLDKGRLEAFFDTLLAGYDLMLEGTHFGAAA